MQRHTLGFLVTLALSLFATALAAEAQQATKGHRIGWLSAGFPRPDRDPPVDAFRQGLRELGYVKGQNLLIAYRGADGGAAPRPGGRVGPAPGGGDCGSGNLSDPCGPARDAHDPDRDDGHP